MTQFKSNLFTQVYDITFTVTEGGEKIEKKISIRALNTRQAKQICKQLTGALIKDMQILYTKGYGFKADND